ncbi:MAG: hypothetical protein IH627_12920 [Rubrivivax sp.]|nr:hypothetical protein [Rubrivivax sp.]
MPCRRTPCPRSPFTTSDGWKGFESAPLADFKATREQIRNVYQGLLIESTKELVPVDALDSSGRYRRVATGWGQLG